MVRANSITTSTILTSIAKILSVLLHPVFLAFVMLTGTLIVFMPTMPLRSHLPFIIFITAVTILIPCATIYILKLLKVINSILLSQSSRERAMPLGLAAITYGYAYYLMISLNPTAFAYRCLTGDFLVMGILCVCLAIISRKYKISMHTAAAAAVWGMCVKIAISLGFTSTFGDIGIFVVLASLVCGLSGWARLFLNHHTPNEVYAGYGLGAAVSIIVFFILDL